MAKQEKRNSRDDVKRETADNAEYEIERRRLEKWRPGRRNFP